MLKNPNLLRKNSKARPKSINQQGFTLVEILFVIAIISVLMTTVGPVFNSLATSQSPAAAASVVAGQLERARSHAIAKNTYVWVRMGQGTANRYELNMSVWESIDGTDSVNAANTRRVWTSPRLPNFLVGSAVGAAALPRPAATAVVDESWVRFSPMGEAGAIASAGPSPPVGGGTITPWTEFGLQATRGNGNMIPNEIAAVHLNGLTGQTLKFYR